MAEIPHFDLPFRYSGGRAAVNQQGTVDDIAACVYAVAATDPGQFLDLPLFGLPDLVGSEVPIPTAALILPISVWEPRAKILAEINPDRFDAAIENANIQVVS